MGAFDHLIPEGDDAKPEVAGPFDHLIPEKKEDRPYYTFTRGAVPDKEIDDVREPSRQGTGLATQFWDRVTPNALKGALANAPGGDGTESAMLKGAATAAIKGTVGGTLGMPGDMRNMADYLVQRAHSWLSGTPMEELQQRRAALEGKKAELEKANPWMGVVQPPPPGEFFYNPILAKTGEYHPTTPQGQLAMAGVEGLTSGVGLGTAMGLGKGAKGMIASGAKAAPMGAVQGTAADALTQATGDPLAGLAAGVAPSAIGAKFPGIHQKIVAPMEDYIGAIFSKDSRKRQAAQKFAGDATDAEKALADLRFQPHEIVEGGAPTTAEITGDAGLLGAQKREIVLNQPTTLDGRPQSFRDVVTEKNTQKNAAQIRDIEKMAPQADPMDAVRLYQQRRAQIDDEMQGWLTDAEAKARAAHETVPGSIAPEVSGAQLRTTVAENMEKARKARAALYDAVDPDGTLSVLTVDARNAGAGLKSGIDPAVTLPSQFSDPVIDMVAKLGDVTPFKKLNDLDATITSQMAAAKRAGDYTGHAQLVQMKQAVMADINNAIENQVKFQQNKAARGELAPEETLGERLRAWNQGYERQQSELAAGQNLGATASGETAPGSRAVSPISGTQRPGGGGRPDAEGYRGVQGIEPSFDPEAAQRLTAAKKAHAEFAQTYRQGPIKSLLKDEGYAGQYRMPDAAITAKAFPGGDNGYTATQTHLRAANNSPEAIGAVENMAVYRLNQAMKDGELTQAGLDGWKRKYGTSLKAIDEVSPGFSQRFDNVAAATNELATVRAAREAALAQAQSGAAAKLMGLTDASEVTTALGKMLTAADGPTQIKRLVTDASMGAAMGPRALDGLRRAGVDYILGKTANAGVQASEATLSSAKVRSMLENNEAALVALYGRDGVANLRRVAADMERTAAAMNVVTPKMGEASAQQTVPMLHSLIQNPKSMGTGSLAYLAGLVTVMQQYGIGAGSAMIGGHYAAALTQKLHARGISKIDDLYRAGLIDPKVGDALLSRAITEKGELNQAGINRLLKALARSNEMLDTYRDDARVGRNTGGRIFDHSGRAKSLIRAADRAKNMLNGHTEHILGMPDEHVVKALAVANAAMR